jgi:Domain of unknown function (DUF4349)
MTEPSAPATVLEVIDATLAGEAVAPEYADLAELSLILAADRGTPSATFAAELDERAAHRFSGAPAQARRVGRRSRWQWLFAPGLAVGTAAIVAVVVVLAGGGGARNTASPPAARDTSAVAASSQARRRPASNLGASSSSTAAASPGRPSAAGAVNGSAASAAAQLAPDSAPTPSTTGRQIVQSAQVSLSTPANRVDDVAQQVFNVVATQNGVVKSSNITSTSTYGNAQFSLSVPSANLSRTLNALSHLHGANVVSRSDATQDITGQVGSAGNRLAEARALRTSLLRQLAAATTTTAVSSLKAQIADADAAINSDLAALHSLQRSVAYSQIAVTVNSVSLPVTSASRGGGFTLSRAVHDAGRVLVVVAGVGLIALAVLMPIGLLVALGVWLSVVLRRRRREQVLDLI